MSDPAAAYEALRASTAEMLKLDVTNLSLVAGLQLDLVSLLRLQVDELQGAALAGGAVDLDRLSTALQMLQKLLPAQALTASVAPAADAREDDAAYRQIAEMIDRLIAADEHKMAQDPAAARAKFEEKLQRAIENNNPGGGEECEGDVVHRPSPRAAAGSWPAPVEPPAPQQPQQTSPRPLTDIEKMDRVNATPALPPPPPAEPWRAHVDASGIRAPWFRPHG